jgi:hypothetical protein
MILSTVFDKNFLLDLKGKTIQHLYYFPRHGWGMTFGLKAMQAMILNFDNIHPSLGFDSHVNGDWLKRFQPHGIDRFFHDKKILDVEIDGLHLVTFQLENASSGSIKPVKWILQVSPYAPRFFLEDEKGIVFDSIQGWQPMKPIKKSKVNLTFDPSLTVSKLVIESLMVQYQDIIASMIKKKTNRQEALSKDLVHHRHQLGYQLIAFQIQALPNQPWDVYNNPDQLSQPNGAFITNFDGVTKLFNLYKKAKIGEKEVLHQMEINQSVLNELASILKESQVSTEESIKKVEDYLITHQFISGQKPKPVKVEHFSPYFFIDNGIKFSFGKNAKQNDHLTFSLAKKNEIFIHIKDYPGSHIIIHHGQFDHDLIVKGGQLALALAKKLSAEVTYAKVGSLKRTTQLGQVILKDQKSIKVNANPAWSDKLLDEVKRY